jgi:hypothetical protein
MTDDTFWADLHYKEEAERGRQADPMACGTCRDKVAAGERVEHDGCAQRATLLEPPDMPSYDVLCEMSEDDKRALPARFHVPTFDDCGVPNAWLCRVCWGEGSVSAWPCEAAVKHGTEVFTPDHEAEQAQKMQRAALPIVLGIVATWLDGTVHDIDDLIFDLKQAGHPLPDEAESEPT